jgi:hypothetical protein
MDFRIMVRKVRNAGNAPSAPKKTVRMLVSWDAVFGGVSWCFPRKIPKKCPEDLC